MLPRCISPAVRTSVAIAVLALAGCAFDVSRVDRHPTSFAAASDPSTTWTLLQDRQIDVGSGFPTHLKANTHWMLTGHVPEGDVYATKDQIVTVGASNIFEAQAVVKDAALVGFYLPVEHSIVPVAPPISLPIKKGNQQ